MTTADNQPLGQALAENQAFLQTMFGGSSDFYTKSFTICGCRCCIAMFAGLSSPEKLCIMVLHALGQGVPGCKAGPQLVQYLAEQSCLPTEQTPIITRTQLVEALAGGMAVLLVEGSGQALAFSTQDMPGRSVTNPSGEGNMRGPQDAFTEHLRNNISQLRRQFRTGSFTAEICTANTRAKTEYAICYDTALAPADVVQTLRLLDYADHLRFIRPFVQARYGSEPAQEILSILKDSADDEWTYSRSRKALQPLTGRGDAEFLARVELMASEAIGGVNSAIGAANECGTRMERRLQVFAPDGMVSTSRSPFRGA